MSTSLVFLLYMNVTLLVLTICMLVLIAHKVRRIHLKQFDADRLSNSRIDNLFSQMEALLALNKELALPLGLPSTRDWAASPDFLRHIARYAMDSLPLRVVECSSGASTVVLARVMQINGGSGHVFSLEHDPLYAQKTRQEITRQGLDSYATVIDAPLRPHKLPAGIWNWYETKDLPPMIDLLVIDGPPVSTQSLARYPAIPVLTPRMAAQSRIFLDDADRADEREALARWASEFGWISAETLKAEKGVAVLRKRSV